MNIDELSANHWYDELGNLWNPPYSDRWINYNISNVKLDYGYKIPGWFVGTTNEFEVVYRYIAKYLQNHHRTMEEFYCRFFLNISEVPECANPNCHNKVHILDGKLTHGISKCCSRSCHISLLDYNQWKDPNYMGNQPEFRNMKSIEMTNNLNVWNHDPKFQALSKRGKVLAKEGYEYIFYIARTTSGMLKYGVYMDGTKDYRLWVQDVYNNDAYISFHPLYRGSNKVIAELEFYIKSLFNYNEYMEFSELHTLISILKSIPSKFNIHKYELND